jgi:hypothetical protein
VANGHGAVPVELRQYVTFADELICQRRTGFLKVIESLFRVERAIKSCHAYIPVISALTDVFAELVNVLLPGITAAIKRLIAECPVCVRFSDRDSKGTADVTPTAS